MSKLIFRGSYFLRKFLLPCAGSIKKQQSAFLCFGFLVASYFQDHLFFYLFFLFCAMRAAQIYCLPNIFDTRAPTCCWIAPTLKLQAFAYGSRLRQGYEQTRHLVKQVSVSFDRLRTSGNK